MFPPQLPIFCSDFSSWGWMGRETTWKIGKGWNFCGGSGTILGGNATGDLERELPHSQKSQGLVGIPILGRAGDSG